MTLPIFQSDDQAVQMMQSRWSSALNPVLANPATSGIILKNIMLINGSNTINHLLGRKLQGWRLVRQRAAASIYDQQDSNLKQELTLILVSNANISCDIEVF